MTTPAAPDATPAADAAQTEQAAAAAALVADWPPLDQEDRDALAALLTAPTTQEAPAAETA